MSNAFVSALDKVGDGIKWFFTNKTAVDIEEGGLNIASIAFPALSPLLGGLSKSLAVATGLAQTAQTSGDNTAQVTALVVADAQQVFQEYEQSTGSTIETPQQQAIVNAFIALLQTIPGAAATTPATPAAAAKPTSVQTQAATGTLL